MWANLFLLFWLSLLPIVTGWVGRYPNHALPAATYGAIAFGAAVAYWILVRTIIAANGRDSFVARAVGLDVKGNLSLAMYAAGIGLSFVTPVASYAMYVAVAVIWFVPDRRFVESPVGPEDPELPTDGPGT